MNQTSAEHFPSQYSQHKERNIVVGSPFIHGLSIKFSDNKPCVLVLRSEQVSEIFVYPF